MVNDRICPSCGAAIEGTEARFCPLCGAALPEAQETAGTSVLEEKLRARYRAYNTWVEESCAKEGAGRRLLNLLAISSPFKNSEEHGKFFDDVKAMSEELLKIYSEQPGTGDIAGLLHFTLLECHSFARTEANWMFLAAEQLYLPFLPLLSAGEASKLLPEYNALRKKQKGFDFQVKILRTLKSMAE